MFANNEAWRDLSSALIERYSCIISAWWFTTINEYSNQVIINQRGIVLHGGAAQPLRGKCRYLVCHVSLNRPIPHIKLQNNSKKTKGNFGGNYQNFLFGFVCEREENENLKLELLSKCCWVVELFKADHYCKIKLNNHFDKGGRMHMTHYISLYNYPT